MKKTLYLVFICNACFITSAINAQGKANAVTYANTSLSNLTSPTSINQSLLVDKDNTHNIGSITKGWKNLYLDTAIYVGGSRFIISQTGTGAGNTAIGNDALHETTSASYNTGIGYNALYNTTIGSSNIAVGYKALYNSDEGSENVAIGVSALYTNNYGYDNIAIGRHAMYYNDSGYYDVAVGTQALGYNKSGIDNSALGFRALYNNKYGYSNVACGSESLNSNTSGSFNVAAGDAAMNYNTSGHDNTAIGDAALEYNTSGIGNTAIGSSAGNLLSNKTLYNSTTIGYFSYCTASNQVRLGNSSVTSIGGYVGWSNISDGRVKKNIKQNVPGLLFINKLQPVTYNLDLNAADKITKSNATTDGGNKNIQLPAEEQEARKQKEQVVYTGFIAQDVENSAKALNYDFSGVDAAKNENDLYSLRYADFVVPLVKAVQELSKMNDAKDSIIQTQNSKINNLESRLTKVEALMNMQQSAENYKQTGNISSVSLQQNIPNPFSNSTTINYVLSEQHSSAKIIITDKNGTVLKQLNLSNNKGSITVDAATLTSGAYQYSLYFDGKLAASKQMECIK